MQPTTEIPEGIATIASIIAVVDEAISAPVEGVTYRCECDAPERHRCIVTGHDGSEVMVDYCDDCFELAEIDWNGETASVVKVAELEARRAEARAFDYEGAASTCRRIDQDLDDLHEQMQRLSERIYDLKQEAKEVYEEAAQTALTDDDDGSSEWAGEAFNDAFHEYPGQ